MTAPDEPAIFSNQWRIARIKAGDAALEIAESETVRAAYLGHVYAAIAAAHYAAANVRGKAEATYLDNEILTKTQKILGFQSGRLQQEQEEIQRAQEGKAMDNDPWGQYYDPENERYRFEDMTDVQILGLADGYDDPRIDAVIDAFLELRR